MKKLIIVLAFLPLFCNAQDEISKYSMGDELRIASRHWYTGLIITGVGTGFTVLAINSNDNTFLAPGAVLYLVGFIFMAESWSHIGKAGKKMNKKIGLTLNNGVGIRYRI